MRRVIAGKIDHKPVAVCRRHGITVCLVRGHIEMCIRETPFSGVRIGQGNKRGGIDCFAVMRAGLQIAGLIVPP